MCTSVLAISCRERLPIFCGRLDYKSGDPPLKQNRSKVLENEMTLSSINCLREQVRDI